MTIREDEMVVDDAAIKAALRALWLRGERFPFAERDKIADVIDALSSEREILREALEQMLAEKCDYMRINNLGDPEQQHTVKIARRALTGVTGG